MKVLTYIIVLFLVFGCSKNFDLLENSSQSIVVLADSLNSNIATLYLLEKKEDNGWKIMGSKIPVTLGGNGLGWGKGINPVPKEVLIKKEGDGRSPMGIFNLSTVFGHPAQDSMKNLKFPYLQLNELMECVDDVNSERYNQIVEVNDLSIKDWNSSETMKSDGIWYKLGIVVEHNSPNPQSAAGSCIFIHNWADSTDYTAGCTAMEPDNLKSIVDWLDSDKNPVLIQFTKNIYQKYLDSWHLPYIF